MSENYQARINSIFTVFGIIIIIASFFVPDNLKIGALCLDVAIVIVWTCLPTVGNPYVD